MSVHGLPLTPDTPSSPCSSLTVEDQKTILSSFMHETDSQEILLYKQSTSEPTTAIAMKLPRNLNSTVGNDIIHSANLDLNEFEYKKELSPDILNKYGGHMKKNKTTTTQTKNPRKQRKVIRCLSSMIDIVCVVFSILVCLILHI